MLGVGRTGTGTGGCLLPGCSGCSLHKWRLCAHFIVYRMFLYCACWLLLALFVLCLVEYFTYLPFFNILTLRRIGPRKEQGFAPASCAVYKPNPNPDPNPNPYLELESHTRSISIYIRVSVSGVLSQR